MKEKKYKNDFVQIRLPIPLNNEIKEIAASENRSTNGQVIHMLTAALQELKAIKS